MSFIFLRAFPILKRSSFRGIQGVIHHSQSVSGTWQGFARSGSQVLPSHNLTRSKMGSGAGATGTAGFRQPPPEAACASEGLGTGTSNPTWVTHPRQSCCGGAPVRPAPPPLLRGSARLDGRPRERRGDLGSELTAASCLPSRPQRVLWKLY